MSYLRKVRFTQLRGEQVKNPIYGYIEYLTSAPVKDGRTGVTSQPLIGVYDIDGKAIDVSETFWETLPLYAHIWNEGDFENAIETFRELTDE